MSNANTTDLPANGERIVLTTKPYRDTPTQRVHEVRVVGRDDLHLITERKPGSRHYVPVTTIVGWVTL